MKKLAVLGSTGSIGKNTLKVARRFQGELRITALAAHSNIDLLEKQALEFRPEIVGVFDKEKAFVLQKRLSSCKVLGGAEGICALAAHDHVDLVVSSIVGMAGLLPTASAIKSGKDLALANKEVLVSAGSFIMPLVKKHGIQLLPIDSEHNAIFQCLYGEDFEEVRRIILTASGGPFRDFSLEDLKGATIEQALKNPNWEMGPKVSIDSSTLMNKGLEMIEAHWLFGLDPKRIDVVIHKQSVIHSMVEFCDGSIKAQMNKPDMINPIQHAIMYPKRYSSMFPPFSFEEYSTLHFSKPDFKKFPCLNLAYQAVEKGGSLPCYMNAVNEVLVNRFLEKEIAWWDIANKLEFLMLKHEVKEGLSLEDLLVVDELAREEAKAI